MKRYDGVPFNSGEDMVEDPQGKYVAYEDVLTLINALKFYGDRKNWGRDWDAHKCGIEETQYSVMTHDLEQINDSFSSSGKTARDALKAAGLE